MRNAWQFFVQFTSKVFVLLFGSEGTSDRDSLDTTPDTVISVIDLIDPFKDDMITDPAFKGSNSIKDVLPVLVPKLSYNDLDIKDGGTGASKWKAGTFKDGPDREMVYADLKKYCKRDTEVMVNIHEALAN